MPTIIDSFRGDYGFLSNFYPAPTEYQGIVYPSAENAYQAAKTLMDRKPFESMTPAAAKKAGRQVKLRPDWDQVQLKVMRQIVFSKFSGNPDLARLLLATGSTELVEGNTWNDTFWGVCKGTGENHLGKILMSVRRHLWWNALPQGERVIYHSFGMIATEAKTDPLCKQVWHSIQHMMAIATGAELERMIIVSTESKIPSLIDILCEDISGYDNLMRDVKKDCAEHCDCFNPEGCPKEYPEGNGKQCFHHYCDKFAWIIDRAKHYGEKLNLPWEAILDEWEDNRGYWYMNYYQDCNQPEIKGDQVRVFETAEELKQSVGAKQFRCPTCGEITNSPYVCHICDWKVYGLLLPENTVFVYCKEKLKGENWFMPVAWE